MTGRPVTRVTAIRVFDQAEFDRFAALTGDDNPIHVDPEFSARTRFGRTVAHGMLLYGALWGLLRDRYPTAVQESQALMFPAPTFAGDTMILEIEELDRPAPGCRELSMQILRRLDGTATLKGRCRIRLAEGGAP